MVQEVQVVVGPGPGRRGNRLPAIDALGHNAAHATSSEFERTTSIFPSLNGSLKMELTKYITESAARTG
jgi:hypothetical protein